MNEDCGLYFTVDVVAVGGGGGGAVGSGGHGSGRVLTSHGYVLSLVSTPDL